MATELRQEEVSYFTSARQILCQELSGTGAPRRTKVGERHLKETRILEISYKDCFHNFDNAAAASSNTRLSRHSAVSVRARKGILRSRSVLARVQRLED
jgi:hypothetical protein